MLSMSLVEEKKKSIDVDSAALHSAECHGQKITGGSGTSDIARLAPVLHTQDTGRRAVSAD